MKCRSLWRTSRRLARSELADTSKGLLLALARLHSRMKAYVCTHSVLL
jgi:hypothetical protein